MKKIVLCAGLASIATGVAAQSGPDMMFEGAIAYGISTDFSDDFEYVTLDFSLEGQFPGSAGLGYFLDYESLAESSDLGDNIDALYYGLTYDVGPGTLQFGRPKSVITDFTDGPRYGQDPSFRIFLSSFTGSILELLTLDEEDIYGLRYDGNYGQFNVGLSLHYSQSADVTLSSAALSYDAGNFTPFVLVETLSEFGPGEETRFSLGTKYADGPFSGLISYTMNAAFDPDLSSLLLTGEYQVNDNFEAGLTILQIDGGGGAEEIYGIGGQYTFDVGAYVRADVTAFSSGGDDPIYNFEVGYEF